MNIDTIGLLKTMNSASNFVQVETDAEKIARLEHDLAECYKLTGADSDGNEDWRLAPEAVKEVRRMRTELDVVEKQLMDELED